MFPTHSVIAAKVALVRRSIPPEGADEPEDLDQMLLHRRHRRDQTPCQRDTPIDLVELADHRAGIEGALYRGVEQ